MYMDYEPKRLILRPEETDLTFLSLFSCVSFKIVNANILVAVWPRLERHIT